VPLEVEVVLVGFSGNGGYGYKLEAERLLSLLSTHLQWFCPASWETEDELGVCMHVNFQVVGDDDAMVRGTAQRSRTRSAAPARHSIIIA
jgi:hypothetical protein